MIQTDSILQKLYRKEDNLLTFSNFFSPEDTHELKTKLMDSIERSSHKLNLPDGYFSPYPYSVVHKSIENSERMYFDYSASSYDEQRELLLKLKNRLEEKIEDTLELLTYKNGRAFSSFNMRFLYNEKNGIDIHCENAFLHQLEDGFKGFMLSKIDLKNSISFFVILQKPTAGGELILFNKEWDDIAINLGTTTQEERKDLQGSIFKNRGVVDIEHRYTHLQEGDAVLFRAGQIWHTINRIGVGKDRITIGCFIAKGYDGKNYFWA